MIGIGADPVTDTYAGHPSTHEQRTVGPWWSLELEVFSLLKSLDELLSMENTPQDKTNWAKLGAREIGASSTMLS